MSDTGEIIESATVQYTGNMKYRAIDEKGNQVYMEAAPRVGGSGRGTAPLELFLASLGGCIGVNAMTVLKEMGKEYSALQVQVRGFRKGEIPRLFKKIDVHIIISGNLDEETVRRALNLVVGSRCPLSVLIGSTVKLNWDFKLINDKGKVMHPNN